MPDSLKNKNPIKAINGIPSSIIWSAFPKSTPKWITNTIKYVVGKSEITYKNEDLVEYTKDSFTVTVTTKNEIKSIFISVDDSEKTAIHISEVQPWPLASQASLVFEVEAGAAIDAVITDYLKNKQKYLQQDQTVVEFSALNLSKIDFWDAKKESTKDYEFSEDFCGFVNVDKTERIYNIVFIATKLEQILIRKESFWKIKAQIISGDTPLFATLIAHELAFADKPELGKQYTADVLFMIKLAQ